MTWTRDEVEEMHRRYIDDDVTLRELGAAHGISHERVRQLFTREGLPTQKASAQHRRRLHNAEEALRRSDEITEAYKRLGNIKETARAVGLPTIHIRPIIKSLPNAALYKNKAAGPLYEAGYVLECLKRAAKLKGEPLTLPAYNSVAREQGLPAFLTVKRVLGVDTWEEACKLAEVKANPARGRRATSISRETCLDAVQEAVDDLGPNIIYEQYDNWAREHSKPSGPTVRVVVGSWREALRAALDAS